MTLPGLSVRRPVLAAVLALLIFVLGLAALLGLPVREYPDVERPVVSVTTALPGGAAEVVERDATRILEDALSEVEGIDVIESQSGAGQSSIDVTFDLGVDLDAAAAEVRDAVGAVLNDLPDDAEEPVIAKAAADASAMMWLTLRSDLRDPLALTDLADRQLVDPLSVLPGVARVQIGGEQRYAMRIDLDVTRMAALDVTASDVAEALEGQNVEIPAGRITGSEREFTVRTDTQLEDEAGFGQIVLRRDDDGRVTLADVAAISVGPEDRRTATFTDGEASVSLGIIRAIDANTLAVAEAVAAEVETLRETLPADVDFAVSFNEAEFVEESIREIVTTLAITAALVVGVIVVFLGSFRGALVPALTIPVALMGTFAVLWLAGFSLNVLTLLALVLSIGLVVDDAIVVLENVTRRMEEGEARLAAAVRGGEEVFLPVVATTAVLVAVLAPVAALTGTTGRLFTEFAVALMAALVISSVLALTLGAAVVSLVGRPPQKRRRGALAIAGRAIEGAGARYGRAMERLLRYPWAAVALCVLVGGAGVAIYPLIPAELAPDEDRGTAIVRIDTAPGATIDQTIGAFAAIEEIVGEYRGDGSQHPVAGTQVIIGPGGGGADAVTSGIMIVRLKHWDDRGMSQMNLVDELNERIAALPMLDGTVTNPSGLVTGLGAPIQFVIVGPDYELAEDWARAVLDEVEPEIAAGISLDFERTTPQVRVEVNRALAADLGIDAAEIGEALRVVLGGDEVTDFIYDGETYEVIVRAAPDDRARPDDLDRIPVRTADGGLVPLALVAHAEVIGAPDTYDRVDRRPAMILSGTPQGAPLGEVLERLGQAAERVVPEEGGTTTLGQSREFEESQAGMLAVFALALVVVYLTLAALFDSFAYPVVILVAVPLAIAGGLTAMLLGGLSFGIYAQISLLLLIGLLAKNAILVVDFANNRRSEGVEVFEAVMMAVRTRFRPILMTSIATGFGAIPLALASGAGAEARGAIGLVVLVGVACATLVTLFIVPGLYLVVSRIAKVPGGRTADVERELREG